LRQIDPRVCSALTLLMRGNFRFALQREGNFVGPDQQLLAAKGRHFQCYDAAARAAQSTGGNVEEKRAPILCLFCERGDDVARKASPAAFRR
jgi:hypothetical protein